MTFDMAISQILTHNLSEVVQLVSASKSAATPADSRRALELAKAHAEVAAAVIQRDDRPVDEAMFLGARMVQTHQRTGYLATGRFGTSEPAPARRGQIVNYLIGRANRSRSLGLPHVAEVFEQAARSI